MILCSQAEPKSIIELLGATIDPDCENIWGADFMWHTDYGIALVQRKRFPSDFLASYRGDDRLNKEIKQMQDKYEYSQWRYLILEMDPALNGRVPWTNDGYLVGQFQGRGGISRAEVTGLCESLDHFSQIKTRWTTGIPDTADTINFLYKWTTKESHQGFLPKRQTPDKLTVEQRTGDWRAFALTSFAGIGIKRAHAILKHDPSALKWNDGLKLEDVPGIGKIKAAELRESLRPR